MTLNVVLLFIKIIKNNNEMTDVLVKKCDKMYFLMFDDGIGCLVEREIVNGVVDDLDQMLSDEIATELIHLVCCRATNDVDVVMLLYESNVMSCREMCVL